MIKHFPVTQHLDLSPNHHQLQTVLNLAVLNHAGQKMQRHNIEDIINFPALHQDLFKLANEGPFGSVIRQIIDGMIMLSALEQFFLFKTLEELENREKEKAEESDSDFSVENFDSGTIPQPQPQTEVTSEHKSKDTSTIKTSAQYQKILFRYQQRILDLATHYIRALSTLIAQTTLAIRAEATEKLGYHFEKEELEIFDSAPSLEKIQSVVNESYKNAGISTRVGMTKDHPPASLASATQLELKTLMMLNAYWNRQHNDMVDALASEKTAASGASQVNSHTDTLTKTGTNNNQQNEKSEALRDLRAGFDQKYKPKNSNTDQQNTIDTQHNISNSNLTPTPTSTTAPTPTPTPEKREAKVIYSASDALKLLREFKKSCPSLDNYVQDLNKIHQQHQEDSQKIYEEMRSQIDAMKVKKGSAPTPTTLEKPQTLGK